MELKPKRPKILSKLTVELLICSVFLPPYVSVTFTGDMLLGTYNYNLSEILLTIMLLRTYLIIRLYEHYSEWTSSKSRNTCKRYSAKCNFMFALKSDLKVNSFMTITTSLIIILVVIGVAVMQAEKNFISQLPNQPPLNVLTNNEWLIVVTMATIGYGDFYPSTHQGRFFCIVACIAGMVLVSSLVVAMGIQIEFTEGQKIAYLNIQEKKKLENNLHSAANLIKAAFKCKASRGLLKRYKMGLSLKQIAFEFGKVRKVNSTMNVTSTEMLYELGTAIEKKLGDTRRAIESLPNLEVRCNKLKTAQLDIEDKVVEILNQQAMIMEYINQKTESFQK